MRVLQFRTGNGLTFDILVDRGFDLDSLEYREAALGFHSPTGFRSPWLHNAEGEVVQATMFAENLHLLRRVEIEVGTHAIQYTTK